MSVPRIGAGKELDTAQKIVRLGIKGYTKVNKVFNNVTACLFVIIVPQLTAYQRRVCWIYLVQLLSNDLVLICVAKALQLSYEIQNFLLLLSVGSLIPFLRALYNLMFFIPCPPLPAVITNVVLIFALVVLLSLGITTYAPLLGFWGVYGFITLVWPWLVLASMISRLYVQRTSGKNPFSPVRELPALGLTGAAAHVFMILAAKELSVSDCIVLSCLDPLFAALLACIVLGKNRRQLHFKCVQIYLAIAVLICGYLFGDQGPGKLQVQPPTQRHLQFAFARLLLVARSIYVKWQYATNYHATIPNTPPEGGLLFYSGIEKPKKNRFKNFPAPTLLTLDAIFDSGLRDTDLHGMGPMGTSDLHMLTDSSYLLPIASLMAWLYEQDTLQNGILPQFLSGDNGQQTASAVAIAASGTAAEGASVTPIIYEEVSTYDMFIVVVLLLFFCLARIATPWATARSLFDRGSTLHVWKYQPILVVTPLFVLDVLALNGGLSKFQIVIIMLLALVVALYRASLWDTFKRKHLLLCTQELHYYQPAVLRKLQRRTLLEFLDRTSTDDYGVMLLETSIRHGGNVRELARDTSVEIWDPTPSATAAWKLAFSLVTKALKRQKYVRKQRMEAKHEVERWIASVVINMVYKAVENSAGHGARLKCAGNLAKALAKRRALKQLQALAERRRHLRLKRKSGQLSAAPEQLATAGGQIRSIRDMMASTMANQRSMPLSPGGGRGAGAVMSLTAGNGMSGAMRGGDEEAPLLSMPGEIGTGDIDITETSRPFGSLPDRGVWLTGKGPDGAPPGARLVLAFGVARHGQLGIDPSVAAKQMTRSLALTVDELRGCEPVQVVAAGVASFAVGARGQVWAFGSNRSMELGQRKEVAQVNQPQRVKSVRQQRAVQIAACVAASGQAHSLMLTEEGQVYTFGASSRGALGQGPEVRQSGPLLLRMSTQVKIKMISAGARHSLMVTDEGKVYTIGDNSHGQLGFGQRDAAAAWKPKMVDTPYPVEGELADLKVRLLAAGDDHALAATEDGRLFAWGANANGQLGLGRVDDQAVPMAVRELQGAGITSLAAGSRHSLVVAQRGTQVWAFGSNVQGQLGIGQAGTAAAQQLTYPVLVHALTNQLHMEIIQVTAAACHSMAVTRAGEVMSFGDNAYGQLGFQPERDGTSAPQRPGEAQGIGNAKRSSRAMQIDAPEAYASGVGRLYVPTRIVSLAAYRVRAASTAEMHTLVLAD